MADAPLTLGTAGHIDHGKTALIRALTGKETDRLPEERKRGISIELGYARLQLPSGRSLSVVDVPGHERFVRTMVAGATGIDLFLICIAADDGVMPQTREHWAVLRQLGVAHGVVAITKADVADPEAAIEEARELIPDAEIVPVSAVTGAGLDDLRAAIERAAEAAPGRADAAPRGVAPGRADAAPPRARGDAPLRLHVDRSFTLRGIGTVVTGTLWSGSVGAGDQVEILPARRQARVRSVQVHDQQVERADAGQRVALNLVGVRRDEVGRGDVVTGAGEIKPSFIVDARIELEPGAQLPNGARLHVHHGTRESPGRAYPLGDGFVQLRMESPLVADRGDRLILRQLAPPDTIGGGVVIDANARRHGPAVAVVERLTALEAGRDPAAGQSAAPDPRAKSSAGAASAARTPEEEPLGEGARVLLELLQADGARPRTDKELGEAAGLDARVLGREFRALELRGEAVRVGPNLHFAADALASLTARVAEVCVRDGEATIASVRDELATSRKYAQAILEHMDATKLTVRRGDAHVLRPTPSAR